MACEDKGLEVHGRMVQEADAEEVEGRRREAATKNATIGMRTEGRRIRQPTLGVAGRYKIRKGRQGTLGYQEKHWGTEPQSNS